MEVKNLMSIAEILFIILAVVLAIWLIIDIIRHPKSDDDNIINEDWEDWYEDYDLEDESTLDEPYLEFVDDGQLHDIIKVPGHQDLYYSQIDLLVYSVNPENGDDENEYLEGFFSNDMHCIYMDGKVWAVNDNGNIVAIVHPAMLPK